MFPETGLRGIRWLPAGWLIEIDVSGMPDVIFMRRWLCGYMFGKYRQQRHITQRAIQAALGGGIASFVGFSGLRVGSIAGLSVGLIMTLIDGLITALIDGLIAAAVATVGGTVRCGGRVL